jgi:hypothetical protein
LSVQKSKIVLAVLLAALSVSVLLGTGYRFLPSGNVAPIATVPNPQPTSTQISSPVPSPTTNSQIPNPLPVPSPINSSSSNATQTPAPNLLIDWSPQPGINGSLYVAQGGSISINITLTSLSNETEFTLPLYLAIGAYQNQPLGQYLVITTPPAPYSTQLPYPAGQVDTSTGPKPFTASFDSNPLVLKPQEKKTVILTIHAAENATAGAYSMVVELGNWQETNVGGTTFQLTVQGSSQLDTSWVGDVNQMLQNVKTYPNASTDPVLLFHTAELTFTKMAHQNLSNLGTQATTAVTQLAHI